MSQQRHQELRPSQTTESAADRVSNLPVNPSAEAKLDAYLEAICAQTPPAAPAAAVQEMRLEMREHLLAAVSAYCEMGYAEEEAIAHTLTQFGSPQTVARQWRQEWEETLEETAHAPFWPSLRRAIGVWTLAYVGLFGIGAVASYFPTMPQSQRIQLALLAIFGTPLLAGGAVGWLARRRPVASNALASLSVLPLYLLLIICQLNAISPDGWRSALWFAVNPFLIFVPVSSMAAALTAKLRKLAKRRQIAR